MFQNLRLRTKMTLMTGLLIVVTVVLVLLVFGQVHYLHGRLKHFIDHFAPQRSSAYTLRVLLLDIARTEKKTILTNDMEQSRKFAQEGNQLMERFQQELQNLKNLLADETRDEYRRILRDLNTTWKEAYDTKKVIFELAVQNSNVKAFQLMHKELLQKEESMDRMVETLVEQTDKEASETEAMKDANRLVLLQKRRKTLSGIQVMVLKIHRLLPRHNLAKNKEEMAKIEEEAKLLQSRLDALLNELPNQIEDRKPADTIRDQFREMNSLIEQIYQLSRINSDNDSLDLSLGKGLTTTNTCDAILAELIQNLSDQMNRERDLSEATYQFDRWMLLIACLIGIGSSVSLAVIVTRNITSTVRSAVETAEAMARGDLTHRLNLTQRDELGQMTQAMDKVSQTLANIVADIRGVSVQVTGSSGTLTTVSEKVLHMSKEMANQADHVSVSTGQMSMNINTMAAASEEMSMNVASISSASEEMSVNVGTISSAAEQTSRNVQTVTRSIEEMTRAFQDINKDMHEGSVVAGQAMNMAGSATTTMNTLDRAASEINKVTEVIKMIALQTNLLALNATIEATSAGEAGKGFAVVANEIKELANQSGKAAEDIAKKIEGMQSSTREAVAAIQGVAQIIGSIHTSTARITGSVEKQTQAANTISTNVHEASKSVGHIAVSIAEVAKGATDMSRNVGEAASASTDISRNAGEAARGAKDIASSIQGFSQATRETADTAQKVNGAAQQLIRIANELQRLVSQFKIEGN